MDLGQFLFNQSWPLAKLVVSLGLAAFALSQLRRQPVAALLATVAFLIESSLTAFGIWFQYWLTGAAASGMPPERIGFWIGFTRVFTSLAAISALVLLATAVFTGRATHRTNPSDRVAA